MKKVYFSSMNFHQSTLFILHVYFGAKQTLNFTNQPNTHFNGIGADMDVAISGRQVAMKCASYLLCVILCAKKDKTSILYEQLNNIVFYYDPGDACKTLLGLVWLPFSCY